MRPTVVILEQSRHRRRAERALFEAFARDRSVAARDAIVEQFMPMARQLARRYQGADVLDDLEQVAALGLVKAVDRFDPSRGVAFSSFAFPTIQGELRRHLRDCGWSLRVPRSIKEHIGRIEQVSPGLFAELGRAPTVAELAERADVSIEDVLEALQASGARHASSLDQPRHEADGADSAGYEVAIEELGFAAAEDGTMLDDLMRVLAPRERAILCLRFRHDLRQTHIAQLTGLSQMHVSRLIRESIETMRTAAA